MIQDLTGLLGQLSIVFVLVGTAYWALCTAVLASRVRVNPGIGALIGALAWPVGVLVVAVWGLAGRAGRASAAAASPAHRVQPVAPPVARQFVDSTSGWGPPAATAVGPAAYDSSGWGPPISPVSPVSPVTAPSTGSAPAATARRLPWGAVLVSAAALPITLGYLAVSRLLVLHVDSVDVVTGDLRGDTTYLLAWVVAGALTLGLAAVLTPWTDHGWPLVLAATAAAPAALLATGLLMTTSTATTMVMRLGGVVPGDVELGQVESGWGAKTLAGVSWAGLLWCAIALAQLHRRRSASGRPS